MVQIKRRSLMRGEKTQIKKRQKYKCANCGMDISKLARIDYDHITPISMGGTNDLSNFQALCPNCHAEKTQMDRVKIARARRQQKKAASTKKKVKKKPTYTCKLSASDRAWECGKRRASSTCLKAGFFDERCQHLKVSRK